MPNTSTLVGRYAWEPSTTSMISSTPSAKLLWLQSAVSTRLNSCARVQGARSHSLRLRVAAMLAIAPARMLKMVMRNSHGLGAYGAATSNPERK